MKKSNCWAVILILLIIIVFLLYLVLKEDKAEPVSTSQPNNEQQVPTDTDTSNEMEMVDNTKPTAEPENTRLEPDQLEEIFQNHNVYGVKNGPSEPTVFTLTSDRHIYKIENYHWNNRFGKKPGTIGLKSADGTEYGPWQTEGRDGQGGVPNAYWTAYPDIQLPAGTYTIIDSDPISWSQNAQSGNQGMSRVFAVK